MNASSEALLLNVHPKMAYAVRTSYTSLLAHKPMVEIHVVQGTRTYAQQQALYMQNRTHPPTGPWVTNAPGGFSSHNYGLAVDIAPGIPGSPIWKPDWNWKDWDFQLVIASLKAQGLAWGGDWVHVKGDYDHFYLPASPPDPTPLMRADLIAGGLPLVYSEYDKGAYA